MTLDDNNEPIRETPIGPTFERERLEAEIAAWKHTATTLAIATSPAPMGKRVVDGKATAQELHDLYLAQNRAPSLQPLPRRARTLGRIRKRQNPSASKTPLARAPAAPVDSGDLPGPKTPL